MYTPSRIPQVNLLTMCPHEQRRNAGMEYYDTSDPFIDDSELPMDERTFFAQTKQQGFYVSSGEVALLKDKYVAAARKRTLTRH